MKFTNIHSLPEPLVRAVTRHVHRKTGHISVTGLIQPPQKAWLEDKHEDEITIDVSEEIYALLGSSVHAVLERARVDNALQEERISMEIDGWTVSGAPDLLEADGTLTDWKVTSVFSFLLGDKPEWIAQLNMYRMLYALAGFDPKRLQIVAILRDWRKSRGSDEDYPVAPALCVDIPMWPKEQTYRYMQERIALHKKARLLGLYPECTPEERWERPEMWAVKKLGNKTALKVFGSPVDAELWAHDYEHAQPPKYAVKKKGADRALKVMDSFEAADLYMRSYVATKGACELEMEHRPGVETEIEHRPGVSVRCQDGYCKAAPWCLQWARIKAEQEKNAPENKTEAA